MQDTIKTLLQFCFKETQPRQWEAVSSDFDADVKRRFFLSYKLAQRGLCDYWLDSAEGTLAYIALLGVLPKFMTRNVKACVTALSLAEDAAVDAINKGFDQLFCVERRKFIYDPLLSANCPEKRALAISRMADFKAKDPVFYKRAKAMSCSKQVLELA